MKQNVGILDSAIRGIIAVICLAIAAEGILPQIGTIIMTFIGGVMWLSASFGLCFLYKILGIDTYPGAGHGLTQYYPDASSSN